MCMQPRLVVVAHDPERERCNHEMQSHDMDMGMVSIDASMWCEDEDETMRGLTPPGINLLMYILWRMAWCR